MKKGLKLLAVLALVVPFTGVKAKDFTILNCEVSQNCYNYPNGSVVNFYRNETEAREGKEDSGQSVITLEDKGASSQYVKSMMWIAEGGNSFAFYDSALDGATDGKDFATFNSHKELLSKIEEHSNYPFESAKKTNDVIDMTLITLDEVKSVFGASDVGDGTYTIDAAKWGKTFAEYASPNKWTRNGFFTSTVDGEDVWVVAFDWTDETVDADITKITVKKVAKEKNVDYGYFAVMWMDKTYECIKRVEEVDKCYVCGEEYLWLTVGSEQSKACTLSQDITTKDKCVKPAPTGVEDHLGELTIGVVVAGLALLVVKRKELFRGL